MLTTLYHPYSPPTEDQRGSVGGGAETWPNQHWGGSSDIPERPNRRFSAGSPGGSAKSHSRRNVRGVEYTLPCITCLQKQLGIKVHATLRIRNIDNLKGVAKRFTPFLGSDY
jgi:hypothetical protein